ncbi:hypothetical protein [Microbacterium sp. cf332]|uniref:hypothetical protein n=1 Tax=Microbacterium sp. cf332 TaxID=1761804 RepID=UPI0008870E95|nr:hypothetical protein [Microbacterium sp. cf332]SDQ47549.1 hypothetical protein SAMN04487847_1549 [Microbacterium sp. cf332]
MDEGVTAELRTLRSRAYAPGGDIAADPAALARLAELEERERRRRVAAAHDPEPEPEPAPPSIVDAVPTFGALRADRRAARPDDAEPEDGADASHDGDGAAASDDDDAGSRARARRRPPLRAVLTWAGSLVAVAVLAVGVTAFATARTARTATALPADANVTHVTTLLPTGAQLPAFFGSYADEQQGQSFEPFLGLAVFQTDIIWAPDDNANTCVFVTRVSDVESSTNDSWTGFMNQGCSAGAFPAAVSFVVREDQPEELLERYPVGTAMQFVLTEAGVDVFVSDAPEPPRSSAASTGTATDAAAGAAAQPAG